MKPTPVLEGAMGQPTSEPTGCEDCAADFRGPGVVLQKELLREEVRNGVKVRQALRVDVQDWRKRILIFRERVTEEALQIGSQPRMPG